MSSFVSTTTALLIAPVASLAVVFAPADPTGSHQSPRMLPLAALAWAQSNCDATLTVRPGTPRIQAEDMLRSAAAYDAVRASAGHDAACAQALSHSARVAR